MTRDDIIRMAQEADDYADRLLGKGEFHPDKHDVRDDHFAALVAAAEREACAKLCEDSLYCAAVIRSSDNKGIKWEVEP